MKIFGDHDEATIQQLKRCAAAERDAPAVLCADGHLGYSMPIGGVVAYRDHVSPSGVGYDIACGNLAVRTTLRAADLTPGDYSRIADAIAARVSFGMGRRNSEPIRDHPGLRRHRHVSERWAASPAAPGARAARDRRRWKPLRRRARG
jgi:tRNA-splicing ligase RtcB